MTLAVGAPKHPGRAVFPKKTARSSHDVRCDDNVFDHDLEVLLSHWQERYWLKNRQTGTTLPVARQLFAGLFGRYEWDAFKLSVIFLKIKEFAVFRETRPIKVGLSQVAVRL